MPSSDTALALAVYTEAPSSSASPVHRARLGSARLARLFSFTLAGGDDSLSDDCARRRSAFHSFGRLSLKIFAFDRTAATAAAAVAALSRLSARARARTLTLHCKGEGRVEGGKWDRERGLIQGGSKRGWKRAAGVCDLPSGIRTRADELDSIRVGAG